MSQKRLEEICANMAKVANADEGKRHRVDFVMAAAVVEQLELISDALWEIRDELSAIKGRQER